MFSEDVAQKRAESTIKLLESLQKKMESEDSSVYKEAQLMMLKSIQILGELEINFKAVEVGDKAVRRLPKPEDI